MRPVLIVAMIAGIGCVAPVLAQQADHVATAGNISIVHPWARAAQAGADGLVFMEIENSGSADRLVGARTEMAGAVHIVGLTLSGDEIAIQEVGAVEIATGDFVLDPGGVALELHDLAAPLVQGEHFELVVEFAMAGEVTIEVEIEAAGAAQHSHAGHSH